MMLLLYATASSETIAQSCDGIIEYVSQATALETIIYQCPDCGGTAVYTARGLYELFQHVEYDDELICSTANNAISNNGISNAVSTEIQEITVYPNPAYNEMTVKYALSQETDGILLIKNLQGQQVAKYPLSGGQNVATFDISSFASGLYLLSIQQDSKQIYQGKLVVQNNR